MNKTIATLVTAAALVLVPAVPAQAAGLGSIYFSYDSTPSRLKITLKWGVGPEWDRYMDDGTRRDAAGFYVPSGYCGTAPVGRAGVNRYSGGRWHQLQSGERITLTVKGC